MEPASDKSLHDRIEHLERQVAELQRSLKQLQATPAATWREVTTAAELPVAGIKPPSPEAVAQGPQDKPPVAKTPTYSASAPPRPAAAVQPQATMASSAAAQPRATTLPPIRAVPHRTAPAPSGPAKPPTAIPTRKTKESFDWVGKGQYWMGMIGIAFLLVGMAFLFKYSIDQGWISEEVRVVFGLGVGLCLLVIGVLIHERRRYLSPILMGGSIAAFYSSIFAAFGIYDLIEYPVAFGCMAAVTVLGFFLSVTQREVSLALIAVTGGLGTPFILYKGGEGVVNTGEGDLAALAGYTCVVLAVAGAIYLKKGWRYVLWGSVVGGWAVFLVGVLKAMPSDPNEALGERWAMQLGLFFCVLVFWAVPVIREVLSAKNPSRWTPPDDFLSRTSDKEIRDLANWHIHILSVVAPFVTLVISLGIWELSVETWGGFIMGGAIVYGASAWGLRVWSGTKSPAYTQAMVSLLLLTLSLCLLLWHRPDILFVVLMAEVTILQLIARRFSDHVVEVGTHVLFGGLACWLACRLLIVAQEGHPIGNINALTEMSFFAVAWAVSAFAESKAVRQAYRVAGYVAVTGWFIRELHGEPNILFGVLIAEGVLLHVLSRRLLDQVTEASGHVLFGGLALWLAYRLLSEEVTGRPIFNVNALVELSLVVVAWCLSAFLEKREARQVYRVAGYAAITCLFVRQLEGDLLFGILIAEAFLLYFLSRRISDRATEASAHVLFGGLAVALACILCFVEGEGSPIFNLHALVEVSLILAALLVSAAQQKEEGRQIYRIAAYIAIAGLLLRELHEQSDILFALLVMEALVLHIVARLISDRNTEICAHLLYAVLGGWLFQRLVEVGAKGTPILNPQASVELYLIVSAVVISMLCEVKTARPVYRLCAHLALLGWFYRELHTVDNGQAYITIVWGVYALALLVMGLRLNIYYVRVVALITLFVMVAKLCFLDFSFREIDAVWRVLSFMGFGILFLVLSYCFPSLWKPETKPTPEAAMVKPQPVEKEPQSADAEPEIEPAVQETKFIEDKPKSSPAVSIMAELLSELEHNAEVGRRSGEGADTGYLLQAFQSACYYRVSGSGELRALPSPVFQSIVKAYRDLIRLDGLLRGAQSESKWDDNLSAVLKDTTLSFDEAAEKLWDHLELE